MIRPFLANLFAVAGLMSACTISNKSEPGKVNCECDTLKTKAIITGKDFNRIPQYDTAAFTRSDFYELDDTANRMLWYRDIENIDTTRFTRLWNDYAPFNYHASHPDFIKYYKDKKDIELAFQFGPNRDLWAYHIFVIKKVGCCFLVTRSYFRHARFTYKAYSVINGKQLDTLYSILDRVNTKPVGDSLEYRYCGFFADNRNRKTFFIEFEKEVEESKTNGEEPKPKKVIEDLYEFVDSKINWTKTYSL